MQENEWKLLVRFMLFVMSWMVTSKPPVGDVRVITQTLKDDLEVELSR